MQFGILERRRTITYVSSWSLTPCQCASDCRSSRVDRPSVEPLLGPVQGLILRFTCPWLILCPMSSSGVRWPPYAIPQALLSGVKTPLRPFQGASERRNGPLRPVHVAPENKGVPTFITHKQYFPNGARTASVPTLSRSISNMPNHLKALEGQNAKDAPFEGHGVSAITHIIGLTLGCQCIRFH